MSAVLDAALAYAARRWRVFPVKSGEKTPLIKEWQRQATIDAALINRWWATWPAANVGIATGDGLIVVDVDPRHGGDKSLAQREVPETYAVRTGSGGRHLYFTHSAEVRNSAGKIGDGIDVRGDGGYVVAPPSVLTSGGSYALLSDRPLAPLPSWALNGSESSHESQVLQGGRNVFLTSEAGRLRGLGLDEGDLLAKLLELNAARCDPPLPEAEVAQIAKSVARYAPNRHLTDLGNADRLVSRHRDKLRYCVPWRAWLVWDGKRWKKDDLQAAVKLAHETVQAIYAEAAADEDDERRKQLVRHGLRSEAAGKVSAMLQSAQPYLATRPDEFDLDPWLLNVENGTLDLRTGELRAHRREDLITKLAPVHYRPQARSELWNGFIRDCTAGDTELAGYLQRAAGYTMTGRTTEHALFFAYGPTETGKSKFTGALKDVLGDYAMQTSFETFLAKRYGGGASDAIADLAGARLVLSIEADKNRRFAEAELKHLTGGDTVRARHLYQDSAEFCPQFKLWLAANHAPRASDDDDAIWRRMNVVPFERRVPPEKRDPALGDKLAQPKERTAILAWMLAGCLAWQADGLKTPARVVAATAQYREEMNPLGDFFESHCVFATDAWVAWTELRGAYVGWSQRNGVRHGLTEKEMRQRLRDRGCEPKKRNNERGWLGVKLVIDEAAEEVRDEARF